MMKIMDREDGSHHRRYVSQIRVLADDLPSLTAVPCSESFGAPENGGTVREQGTEEMPTIEYPITGVHQPLRRSERIQARTNSDHQNNSNRGGCDGC